MEIAELQDKIYAYVEAAKGKKKLKEKDKPKPKAKGKIKVEADRIKGDLDDFLKDSRGGGSYAGYCSHADHCRVGRELPAAKPFVERPQIRFRRGLGHLLAGVLCTRRAARAHGTC